MPTMVRVNSRTEDPSRDPNKIQPHNRRIHDLNLARLSSSEVISLQQSVDTVSWKEIIQPFFPLISWAVWIILGAMYYVLDDNLNWAEALYMSVNVGWSIGWTMKSDLKITLGFTLFSTFHTSVGVVFVGIAVIYIAQEVGKNKDDWIMQMMKKKDLALAAETEGYRDDIVAFFTVYLPKLKIFFVFIIWWIVGIVWYHFTLPPSTNGWELMDFLISTLSGGGYLTIKACSRAQFVVTSLYTTIGVPLMSISLGLVLSLLMEAPEDKSVYEKIVAAVTEEEIEFMKIFEIDDGDGTIDSKEFIILTVVRIGAAPPELINQIHARFGLLDRQHTGKIKYDDLIEGRTSKTNPQDSFGNSILQDRVSCLVESEKELDIEAGCPASSESQTRVKPRNSRMLQLNSKLKSVNIAHKLKQLGRRSSRVGPREEAVVRGVGEASSSHAGAGAGGAVGAAALCEDKSRDVSAKHDDNCEGDVDNDDAAECGGDGSEGGSIHQHVAAGRGVAVVTRQSSSGDRGGGGAVLNEIPEPLDGSADGKVMVFESISVCGGVDECGDSSSDDSSGDLISRPVSLEEKNSERILLSSNEQTVSKFSRVVLNISPELFEPAQKPRSMTDLLADLCAVDSGTHCFPFSHSSDKVVEYGSSEVHNDDSSIYNENGSHDRSRPEVMYGVHEPSEADVMCTPPTPQDLAARQTSDQGCGAKLKALVTSRLSGRRHQKSAYSFKEVADSIQNQSVHEKMEFAKQVLEARKRQQQEDASARSLVTRGVLAMWRNPYVFCFVAWFIWLLVGTVFFTLHEGVSLAKGIYMSVSVGYGIFWVSLTGDNIGRAFLTFHFSVGIFAIALAMAIFARTLISAQKNWYIEAMNRRKLEEAQETEGYRDDVIAAAVYYWPKVKIYIYFFIWMFVGICFCMGTGRWGFADSLYFSVSVMTTGGFMNIGDYAPNWHFVFVSVYIIVGVPVMAIACGLLAHQIANFGREGKLEEKINAQVSEDELEMMKLLKIEDGDGWIDGTEFTILILVRIGALNPDLIGVLYERFRDLDVNQQGKVSYDDLQVKRAVVGLGWR